MPYSFQGHALLDRNSQWSLNSKPRLLNLFAFLTSTILSSDCSLILSELINQTTLSALLTCLEQIHSQDLNVSNSKYAFYNVNKIKTTSLLSFKLRNPGKYTPFTSCSHIYTRLGVEGIYQTRCIEPTDGTVLPSWICRYDVLERVTEP